MEKRKCKNPPIIEAVCEFQLSRETKWDNTIPGIVYQEIQDSFPIRESRSIQQFTIGAREMAAPEAQGIEQVLQIREMSVFLKKDRKTMIQIGKNLLAINQLQPYLGWDNFKRDIDLAYKTLIKAIVPHPISGFERIGLRYINRIEVPKDADAGKFFNPVVKFSENTKPEFFEATFIFNITETDKCKAQFKKEITQGNMDSYWIDLDYFLFKPQSIDTNNIWDWVEKAHDKIYELFDNSITEITKTSFNKE